MEKFEHSQSIRNTNNSFLSEEICPFCDISEKDFFQIFAAQLNNKYHRNFYFYLTKPINQIISNSECELVVLYKEFLYLDDDHEFIQKYFELGESKSKLKRMINFYSKDYHDCYPNLCKIKQFPIINQKNKKKMKVFYHNENKITMNTYSETESEIQIESSSKITSKIDNDNCILNCLSTSKTLFTKKTSFESSIFDIYKSSQLTINENNKELQINNKFDFSSKEKQEKKPEKEPTTTKFDINQVKTILQKIPIKNKENKNNEKNKENLIKKIKQLDIEIKKISNNEKLKKHMTPKKEFVNEIKSLTTKRKERDKKTQKDSKTQSDLKKCVQKKLFINKLSENNKNLINKKKENEPSYNINFQNFILKQKITNQKNSEIKIKKSKLKSEGFLEKAYIVNPRYQNQKQKKINGKTKSFNINQETSTSPLRYFEKNIYSQKKAILSERIDNIPYSYFDMNSLSKMESSFRFISNRIFPSKNSEIFKKFFKSIISNKNEKKNASAEKGYFMNKKFNTGQKKKKIINYSYLKQCRSFLENKLLKNPNELLRNSSDIQYLINTDEKRKIFNSSVSLKKSNNFSNSFITNLLKEKNFQDKFKKKNML